MICLDIAFATGDPVLNFFNSPSLRDQPYLP